MKTLFYCSVGRKGKIKKGIVTKTEIIKETILGIELEREFVTFENRDKKLLSNCFETKEHLENEQKFI